MPDDDLSTSAHPYSMPFESASKDLEKTHTHSCAAPQDETPPAVPGFQIESEIARGGMAVVYRAFDRALNRVVAVKLLQDRFPPESVIAQRFVEEAQITGQLQHPGIPPIYLAGRIPDGRPFLAMKLIKGQTLEEMIKTKMSFNPLAIMEAIAQAVGYAHAHGVIHRDLKPANIMVGAFGDVQVMDWGLSKKVTTGASSPEPGKIEVEASHTTHVVAPRFESDGHTQAGTILGTLSFMPPEQAVGEIDKVDQRADVFGLGAVLCMMLTGKPPYTGGDFEEVRVKAMRGEHGEAHARLDGCGAEPDIIKLCKDCLQFHSADRPADGNAVAAAVARLRAEAEARAKQAEIAQIRAEVQSKEQRKRRRVLAFAMMVLALGLLGTSIGFFWAMQSAEQERQANIIAQLAKAQAEAATLNEHKIRNLPIAFSRTS